MRTPYKMEHIHAFLHETLFNTHHTAAKLSAVTCDFPCNATQSNTVQITTIILYPQTQMPIVTYIGSWLCGTVSILNRRACCFESIIN